MPQAPFRLRCEFTNNPIGISVQQPRLSWWVADDRDAEVQSAYEIIAATSERLLEHDQADVCKAMEGVREGLYGELMSGKGKEEAFLRQLKGDDAASLKNPGSFSVYLLTKVQVVPKWIQEDGYVTIEVL